MKAVSLKLLLAALAVVALGNNEAGASISIELVNVGNAGNAADPATGYGAVSYDYDIGKYDVTIGQYTAFLNAVDVNGTNPNGIYNTAMGTDLNVAGISFTAEAAAGSKYAVMTNGGNSANRPITYVSWFDAARFSNWLQNGQGSGSTETGAYALNGAMSGIITKNANATFWIPSKDEWYKAAYYDPNKAGGAGYWLYPTMSNTEPGNAPGTGGANQANCNTGVYAVTTNPLYSASENYLTDVGAFSGSGSAYGTYDQGGNVYQWTDQVSGSFRGLCGGSWYGSTSFLLSYNSNGCGEPTYEGNEFGFRVASVPEPSTAGLVLLAGAGWMVWKRRKITL